MVTPQDIAEKGFRISFRGYNTEEVDDFLQEIYDSYIEIYEANQKLNETTDRLSDAVGQYKSMEDTLNDALNIAGMSADEIEKSAHSKASEIIKNAELAANSIIAGAEQKIAAEEYRLENIKREIDTYKAKIVELLNAQLCVLNEYPGSASLSGSDTASENDSHMWKKQRNFTKRKVSANAAADITDTKQAAAAAKPSKKFDKFEKTEEDTDLSKTELFEPIKVDAKPEAELKNKIKSKTEAESKLEAKSKTEVKSSDNIDTASDNLSAEDSSAKPSYEEMKEIVFGKPEGDRPTHDTSKLPFISMNENGGYTVRKQIYLD